MRGERATPDAAARLLARNTQTGLVAGRRHVFTVPSVERYPFQWFWDSCFHAIVWASIDVGRAEQEIRALLAFQEADGFVPHVVFWNRALVRRVSWQTLESRGSLRSPPPATALIQPPLLAQAVEAVAATGGAAFVDEALPAIERYYRYLAAERDHDRDGLVSIIAQFESGLDYSPAFDRRRRPSPRALVVDARLPQVIDKLCGYDLRLVFRLNPWHTEDVLVNSVFADALGALARLAARARRPDLAAWASAQCARVGDALLERCYDEGAGLFFNLVGRREHPARVRTIHALLPLLVPGLPADVASRLVEHLTSPHEFWSPYPVPSVALDEQAFIRGSTIGGCRRIWRGPCALSTNWLIARGLRACGYGDVAEEIAARSRRLVELSGFNEFYDPLDGSAAGTPHFGWATLAAVI